MQKIIHSEPTIKMIKPFEISSNPIKAFKLSYSDVFSIPLKEFMKDSILWNGDFKIIGFKKERIYKYWNYHKIPTPFKIWVVRLIYIKKDNDEEWN